MFQPNTTIRFIKCPLQINNAAQIKFDTLQEQENYFLSKVVKTFDKQSYQNTFTGQMKIFINADVLNNLGVNYLMFKNTNYTDKWYYANITGPAIYVNEKVAVVNYVIDDFQTYQFDIDLNHKCFIERRHFHSTKDDENVLMQLPYEDLNVGTDYLACDMVYDPSTNTLNTSFETEQFYYILTTEALENIPATTIIGEQRTTIVPEFKNGAINNDLKITKNGINTVLHGYVLNYKAFNIFMQTDYFQSCVTNGILQSPVLLPWGREMWSGKSLTNYASTIMGSSYQDGCEIYVQSQLGDMQKKVEISEWCSGLNTYINQMINNDDSLKIDLTENAIGKYLYRYPYSLLEVNDFNNQPFNIQLDKLNRHSQFKYLRNNVLPLAKYATIGVTPTLCYQIMGYGNSGFTDAQEYLAENINSIYNKAQSNLNQIQAIITLPVLNDNLAAFMQSNKNQITAQRINLIETLQTTINNAGVSLQAGKTAASYNYQSALTTSKANYSTALIAANNAQEIAVANAKTERDVSRNTQTRTLVNSGTSIVSSLIGRQAGSALKTGLNTLTGIGVQDQNIATQYNNSINNAALAQSAASQIASINVSAATSAAAYSLKANTVSLNADYGNSLRSANLAYNTGIRSLIARQQDAGNLPDSIQSMGNNGSYYNVFNNRDTITFTTRAIAPEPMRRLIDYFTLYGFMVNRLENLKEITDKFSDKKGYYVKTVNAIVEGNLPNDAIQNIKQQFDNGMTIFKPDYYLDYDVLKEN